MSIIGLNKSIFLGLFVAYASTPTSDPIDMREIEENELDYLMMNCWACYESCGFICKNNDNSPVQDNLDSSLGVCCKPGSTSELC